MVASVSNGAQPQIPAATTFKPGDNNLALKNNLNQKENLIANKQVNSSPADNLKLTESTKTEQLNAKTLLSRDNFRADPENLASSSNRGSALDISA